MNISKTWFIIHLCAEDVDAALLERPQRRLLRVGVLHLRRVDLLQSDKYLLDFMETIILYFNLHAPCRIFSHLNSTPRFERPYRQSHCINKLQFRSKIDKTAYSGFE